MISTWLAKTPPLTPLIWDHVNPYGRFELDMNTRFAAQIIQMALVTPLLGLPLLETLCAVLRHSK